jgi:DNA-binding NtrC family response regulator
MVLLPLWRLTLEFLAEFVSGAQNARTFTCKKTSRSRKILGSFEFTADQIGAIRQLVGLTIADVECELIIRTLADQRGSRTEAAKLLGISIRTLRNKIHEYDARGKIVPKPAAH